MLIRKFSWSILGQNPRFWQHCFDTGPGINVLKYRQARQTCYTAMNATYRDQNSYHLAKIINVPAASLGEVRI